MIDAERAKIDVRRRLLDRGPADLYRARYQRQKNADNRREFCEKSDADGNQIPFHQSKMMKYAGGLDQHVQF